MSLGGAATALDNQSRESPNNNLYLGQIEVVHLESASRGLSYEYWEECLIEREYPEILEKMLRFDLGVNRMPQEDYRIIHFMSEAIRAKIRRSLPWLKPFKVRMRKIRFQWVARGMEPVSLDSVAFRDRIYPEASAEGS